ncbi:hypothetical protein EAI_12926, partial [Harpegnathos saltator]
PVVIDGDFNAHSTEWGCSPRQEDPRDGAFVDWAAQLDLLLMNRGSISTCVWLRGESVIDLIWVSPSAARIFREWVVKAGGEILLDHRYIMWSFRLPSPQQ